MALIAVGGFQRETNTSALAKADCGRMQSRQGMRLGPRGPAFAGAVA